MKGKYNLPKTREEKIKALKGLITGQMKINDLRVSEVFVCKHDELDKDFINILSMTDRTIQKVSLAEYQRRERIPNNDVYVLVVYGNKPEEKRTTIYQD
jgi:hypothetical protein